MTPVTGIAAIRPRKLVTLGLFANLFEWYEFSIYGYLSGIIGQLFFQQTTPFLGLIQAFALFAMGYLARPLGALFFGYWGERHGRSASLRISLVMMSAPTVLIGLLPTYQTIGIGATGLLLLMRLIQGFAAGGEFPVTACYVFEAAQPQRRSLMCGIVSNSPNLGFLCGSAVAAALFGLLDQKTLLDWAWRIPFWIGLPLTLWIAALRKEIVEPARPATTTQPVTIAKTLMAGWHSLVQAFALSAFALVAFYVLLVWMPFYLSHFLHIPTARAHAINTGMLCISVLLTTAATWLADRAGFQRVIQISLLATLCFVYPLFKLLSGTTSFSTLLLALLALQVLVSGLMGCVMEALGALLTAARSTGMSLAYTLPASLFGGTTPLICTWLTNKTGLLTFPALYLMSFGLLALPAALGLKPSCPETGGSLR
jgi:MFS transporter, MHS family, proline/betaine transporter